jgi:hypothetical protein
MQHGWKHLWIVSCVAFGITSVFFFLNMKTSFTIKTLYPENSDIHSESQKKMLFGSRVN